MKPWEIAEYMIKHCRALRVRKGRECKICGKTNWCVQMDDGSATLCPRSDGVGAFRKYGEYGYLHIRDGSLQDRPLPPMKKKPERPVAPIDWNGNIKRWTVNGRLAELAEALGVSARVLEELSVGWDGKAWVFPERDGDGTVIGVNRRFVDGSKRCVTGSRRGLTYSLDWATRRKGPILVVEGGSDVAAGLSMDLCTIGRPSNTGGVKHLERLLRDTKRTVLVVGERDRKPDGRWPGMDGCRVVSAALGKALGCKVTGSLLPDGAKDLRGWVNAQPNWEHARAVLLERLKG